VKELTESSDLWYVFNDFAVNQIQSEEVISFFPDWKLPCLLLYSVTTYWLNSKKVKFNFGFFLNIQKSEIRRQEQIQEILINPITADVFKEDKSLAQKSEALQRISFLPLVRMLDLLCVLIF